MTDEFGALACLVNMPSKRVEYLKAEALLSFYNKWKHEATVLDTWFSVQAECPLPGTIDRVRKLMEHPDFEWTNSNRVRALFQTFATANPSQFHNISGEGYRLLADAILTVDPINPQTAAFRLMVPFTEWKSYDTARQDLMKKEMARILAANPSKGVVEKITKSLAF